MTKPNKFDGMMHAYCIGWGFCGNVKDGKPHHVTDYIPKTGNVSADEFVKWILIAEGFDMSSDGGAEFERPLKELFIKHMGCDDVDVSHLSSNYTGT